MRTRRVVAVAANFGARPNPLRLAALACACVFFAAPLFAVPCNVIQHGPPTEADKALLQSDYDRAATLYRAALLQHPGDPDLTLGMARALLHQQKVEQAADAVHAALAISPNSATLLALRGEVEYRQGEPWTATNTLNAALPIDPCNPQTHLLYSKLASLSSLHATALQQIRAAHQVDPTDSEIRGAWLHTLPQKERIAELEAYLASPNGQDSDDLRRMRLYLDQLKNAAAQPRKACHLVSPVSTTDIDFIKLMRDANRIRAFGLDVKLNNHDARLQIDTGAGGLLISRSVAQRAGLKPLAVAEMNGIGDAGPKGGYVAYADSIRIGNLEFQDCTVRVLDARNVMDEVDGLIGMDVFSPFLVTLDFPMRKLSLGPLPARPGAAAAALALKTTNSDSDPDSEAEAGKPPAAPGAPATPAITPKPVSHGPYDRYIAPEMKDYTPVYRVGHNLIFPTVLNDQKPRLFVMDTGAWTTTISPEVARAVTKVHADSRLEVRGISGKVENVYIADAITFKFGRVQQKQTDIPSFDTSQISKNTGLAIAGFLGARTLDLLTIHIDYRDSLVKFDYDPNRGYR